MAAALSIWKDTYFTVPASASPFSYTITVDGNTIFSGKAFVAPDETEIKIKVNDICKDYLSISLPELRSSMSYSTDDTLAVRTFNVTNELGGVLSSYTFTNDWSYELEEYSSSGTTYKAYPINGRKTDGQYIFSTRVSSGGVQKTYTTKYSPSLLAPSGLYTTGFCGNWAIYYLNSYGGWDSFLVEGNVRRKDEYNRLSITTPFNNATLEWGKRAYNNQIRPSFEITTGYLTDSESEVLAKNLLRSNQVYLHDLVRGKVWPVVLTDNAGEFKTFKTNGRKFVTYTINAEASQEEQNIS